MPIRVALHPPAPALLIVALIALSASGTACRQPEAASGAPATAAPPSAAVAPVTAGQVPAPITTILEDIKRGDTNQLAVSPEDGQFLRLLVASTGRKRALEIG